MKLLTALTSQAAAAIQAAQYYEKLKKYSQTLEQKVTERTLALEIANQELQRLATIDDLTQIANRRLFDEYLRQEWRRLVRERVPLSLILCDVDHFKLYNDYYGHQAGDECLKKVAQAMKEAIKRPADLVARYGGEEFAIILSDTNNLGAARVAQEILRVIAKLNVPHALSNVSEYVTLSLGVSSTIPTQDISPKILIDFADKALYKAKKAGRNRYFIHTFRPNLL